MSLPEPPPPLPGARLLFTLDPSIAHLDHAAFGAVPLPVQRAQQRVRDELEASPVRFLGRGVADRLTHTRRHLATFLGADPEGSTLVTTVHAGVAAAMRVLDLRPGDEVVSTDHGHDEIALVVDQGARDTGARHRVVTVPLDGPAANAVEAVTGALTERTRLLVVDQISAVTARSMPVTEIVRAIRGTGVAVLVDGSHGPGVVPAPACPSGVDFWVGGLHTWAFAPRPTALLVVAERWRPLVRARALFWPEEHGFPASVQPHTALDCTPWLAAPAGPFTLRSLGAERVLAHNTALAAYGQQVVGRALGHTAASLPDPAGPVPMRVVPLPTGYAATRDAARSLRQTIADELAVEVGVGSWRGRGLLRLSAQVYNLAEEYDRLARELPELLDQLVTR